MKSLHFFISISIPFISTIFKIKWSKSEEKLSFGGRWVWVPMNPSPPPQIKLRGDAPAYKLTRLLKSKKG